MSTGLSPPRANRAGPPRPPAGATVQLVVSAGDDARLLGSNAPLTGAPVADLRLPLRAHPTSDTPLEDAIRAAIDCKPKGHDFDYSRQRAYGQMSRHMSHTGG